MEKVWYILQKHFPKTAWNISQPQDGQLSASYIAQNERQRVFIKCNVPVDALHRLSEIEVAPRVLASGICDGTTYVVQEYITGRYPDRSWFARHLPFLASFIRRYHDDECTAFLRDFIAAVNKDGNPHAVFQ